MATAVVHLVTLSLCFLHSGTATPFMCTGEFEITRLYFPLPPLPGDFFGNSTYPDSCILLSGDTALSCLDGQTPIHDGEYATPGRVDSSQFMAWNESSRITLIQTGTTNTLVGVRQINLNFYHEPEAGIGLPEFTLSVSISDPTTGASLPYTFLNNQDLSMDDSQVRNVTLALTEPITGDANRFHIEFSLTSDIRQFAVSEVQLCEDEPDIEVETLVLNLTSDPLDGPDILLPANRTGLNEDSTLTLSCTVTNEGRFQWDWESDISTTPRVSDDTRTSTVEIPLNAESEGEHTCTARYRDDTGLAPSPSTGTFTVSLERLLCADITRMDITGLSSVMLQCTLAGYLSDSVSSELITWSFKGMTIDRTSKYTPSVSSDDECPPYSGCGFAFLQIADLNSDDVGDYTCSFEMLSQNITLFIKGDTPGPSPSVTPQPPTTTDKTTTDKSTVNVVAIVSGGVIALIAIIVVILVFIVIIVCCNRRASSKGITFSPSADSQYVDDNDALYTVVSPKDMPPPLPSRPIPGTYASIDSKDNGHMELVAMGSPTLRNSIISMPAEFGTPQSDHMLAKLNINANGQSFPPLRNNPLYSSADNLIRPTAPPPLPNKRGSGSPGSFDEETNLNIYAIPHKPPPLPDRVLSPEPTVPGPIYSEASLSLAQFQSTTSSSSASASVESPDSTSSKICPYASIYADPKPLLKEEGPLEVRPYHIRELRSLGTGQFGQVMLAETLGLSMRDLKLGDSTDKSVSIKVAVKRLKHDADRMVKEAFEKEIKFMARLNHMNVIRMLAICPTGHPFMLMEYMEYGDLNQYLQQYEIAPSGTDPTPSQIQIPSLLYACVQISNGMRYLASLHFIHRDLASRNFLVGKDNSIKIADFGMSRSLYSSHYYRIQGRAILPIRWMATECFYGRFSEKTDVWAFGVAMWEVFTLAKEQPYDDLSDQQVIENAVNTEEIKLLKRPQYCPEEVYEVMLQCWERDPEKRINFEDIYSSLAALHSYSDM